MEINEPSPNLISVLVEIIWGCNLRCALCNVHKIKNQKMSAAQIEEIFKKVPTMRLFTIIGLGEPLTHPEWFDIMLLIKKYSLRLNFVTNGLILDEEKINSLPHQTGVTFSIDSFNNEVYAEMRPGGNLMKTLRNLQMLAQMRPDVSIGIQCIVTKKTYPHIMDMAQFANKFGFGLNLLYPTTYSEEGYKEHYPQTPHPLKNITTPRPCLEPFRSVMIGINGDIYPCTFVYGSISKEEPIVEYIDEYVEGQCTRFSTKPYHLGNIFKDNVYDIWNNEQLKKIRNSVQAPIQPSTDYKTQRDSLDVNENFNYCKMCALRWGKRC